MTVRAIDLFAGAGGFSTGAVAAGVDVVWAANHWQEAVDIHKLNHPDTYHLCQDLHQADWSKLPEHELLLASPACVPGDAKVSTGQNQFKLAEEIEVGDMVLTHKGRLRKVANVWPKQYSGELVHFFCTMLLLMWLDSIRSRV